MATERQIEANRINALKSTGPKSAEGKDRSRLNAVTHGMTSENVEVAARIGGRFATRREAWVETYRPTGEAGDWALDRLVAASFQIEQCERSFRAAAAEQKARAELSWDLDGRAEAAVLLSKIGRQPAVIAARLETSLHGCDALIAAWLGLAAAIEANGNWDESQVFMALDLLGTDLTLRSGRTPLDGPDGCDVLAHRRDFVADELNRLRTLRDEVFAPLDALKREMTEAGAAVFDSKSAQLILRYERDAWRRFREARRDLRRPESEPQTAPAPVVETKPIPVPPPPPRTPVAAPPIGDDDGQFQNAFRRAMLRNVLSDPDAEPAPGSVEEILDFAVGRSRPARP